MMIKKSFTIYMNSIKQYLDESDSLNSNLAAISPDAICAVGYHFLDDYINLLSEAVGDDSDWIEWYVFENEMGKKGMEAGYNGKEEKITNLDQLWGLIQEGKDK
jgi:hypothetical protein